MVRTIVLKGYFTIFHFVISGGSRRNACRRGLPEMGILLPTDRVCDAECPARPQSVRPKKGQCPAGGLELPGRKCALRQDCYCSRKDERGQRIARGHRSPPNRPGI